MKRAIELIHVSKTIKKTQLLFDISLKVDTGEVFGFIGPNGAGKTTTLKTILGIIKPTEGTVKILGESPNLLSLKKKIGFMPENTYLYKYLSGEEFLEFCGKFYDLPKDFLQERIIFVLQKVGLFDVRKKRLSTYSKGMLQRIGLAQAILHNPEIIFLDEPMSGLDPVGRKLVKDLLLELKSQGKTLFFNSHILSDIESICDRFAIIVQGHIVADMPVRDLHEPLEDFFMKTLSTNPSRTYVS